VMNDRDLHTRYAAFLHLGAQKTLDLLRIGFSCGFRHHLGFTRSCNSRGREQDSRQQPQLYCKNFR
jgi:hypothetical protein